MTIIDDFAHHPTAIRETLRALRSVYPKSRLWAVLEPRSNTLRRKVLEGEIVASLRLADRVILAGVYQQERIPEDERLHPEDVVRSLERRGNARRVACGCECDRGVDRPATAIGRCGRHPVEWRVRRHL